MKDLKIYRRVSMLLLATLIVSGLQSQISDRHFNAIDYPIVIKGSGSGMVLTTPDTICIPKKDAVKLLTKAEEGKLLAEKVALLNDQIFLLGERIKEKEQMIAAYDQITQANDSLISSYKKEIQLMADQRKILEQAVADTKKEARRYKRKLFWRTAGGVMVTGGLAYLYFTK